MKRAGREGAVAHYHPSASDDRFGVPSTGPFRARQTAAGFP